VDKPGATPSAIWVISDVALDGTYITTVHADDDTAITLDRDQAVAYAMAVMSAVTRAQYDAAVIAQMAHIGLPLPAAAQAVRGLRADRPPIDDKATAPLRFEPIVKSKSRQPVIHVHLGDRILTEWTPAETQGHAMYVLQVAAGVDLDAAYRRYLVGPVGMDDPTARAVVGDLGKYLSGEA
jgi:hypothetical protein